MEKIKKKLKDYSNTFQEGWKSVSDKRQEWDTFNQRAKSILNKYIDAAKEISYYEFLYVQDKPHPFIKGTNLNSIQFYAGSHPMGLKTDSYDSNSGKVKSELEVENGGCLNFIQLPTGEVMIVFYPSKSKVLEWKEKFIIYKTFSKPSKIKDKHIKNAAEFYIRFSLVTSFACKPTFLDNLRIWWKKFKLQNFFSQIGKGIYYTARVGVAAKTGGII